jgi:tetratricopeptide (TPR) repeat protein
MSEPRSQAAAYWQRVEEMFHVALEMPPEARAEFLRDQCAGDIRLEREVREILRGYVEQEQLAAVTPDEPATRTRYGAFEIVRKIGEGGMGAVYLGRRYKDFDQQAAIKLIRGAPLAMVFLAERFRQERQILAGLDHPNIARLLDGGVSSTGQPYLVMEYVEGVRLDQYCAEQNPTLPQRLELFRKISSAIHFAHQHLVIHRDLKPGNILVTKDGEPRLLDFGIARVLDPSAAPEPAATMTGSLLLTPQYASPEQLRGERCTVASDVYSLGVILYELLAGRNPFSAVTSSTADLIAAVITQEAPRPSTVAPEPARGLLRGDLDGIVMKALARKPADRYGSVEQLSEDIRRQQAGLPVTAVEGTKLYLARKFVMRHRVGVAAAALVVLSLIGGLAGTLWQARVARRERGTAQQNFADARKLANYLLFPLFDSVQTLPGSLPVRADMASQSLQYLDRVSAGLSNDRALSLEVAEGYIRLGTILQAPSGQGDSLGETSRAQDTAQKALAILEPLDRKFPGDARIEEDLAHDNRLLGHLLYFHGKAAEGSARLNEAAAILDRLAAATPRNAGRLVDAGNTYVALMDLQATGGEFIMRSSAKDEVIATGDKAIARFQAALAIAPQDSSALLEIARVYLTESGVQSSTDPSLGIITVKKGLAAFRRLPLTMQSSPEGLTEEARLGARMGWNQWRLGHYDEALKTMQRPREIAEQFATVDPKNAKNMLRLVSTYDTCVQIDIALHHGDAAADDVTKEATMLKRLIALDPANASYRQLLASLQGGVAKFLAKEGRMAEATRYAKASIAYLTEVADRPDATERTLDEASIVLMVTPVLSLRDYPRALRYALRADQFSKGKDYVAVTYLAMAWANNGQPQKALETVRRGLAMVPGAAPGQRPSAARLNLEQEERDIQTLIRTGHLPPTFNQ